MFMQLRYTLGFLLLFFVTTIWAEVSVPPLSHRVTDLTATLTSQQNTALENKLAAFEAQKGSQIAVLILPTTQGEDIAAFGIRVFDSWKIGRKNIDDGVILIIAKDDRKMRIEVGRGLEGAIPDAIAKRILAETIKPHFKNNNYAGGIDAGVNQVIKLIEGESLPAATTPESVATTASSDDSVDWFYVLTCLIAIACFIVIDLMFSKLFKDAKNILFPGIITGVVAAVMESFSRDIFYAILWGTGMFVAGMAASGVLKIIYPFISGRYIISKNRNGYTVITDKKTSHVIVSWDPSSRVSSSNSRNSSSDSWSSGSSSDSWSSSSSSDFSGGGGESSGGGASDSW
jgi:uncharacterized protein